MLDWLQTLPQGSASFLGSLAGSFVGLIALLFGALFNAHLNRRRDDQLRKEETRGLVVALRAELASIEESFTRNTEQLKKLESDYYVPDPMNIVRVFPELISKLGLLDVATIRSVLEAYILAEQYFETLIFHECGTLNEDTLEGRRLIAVPRDRFRSVLNVNEKLISEI